MRTKIYTLISPYAAILKNSSWTLLGQLLPLLTALICVPVLINKLGNERFGFLSIAWMVIGYFSLFDFGLGRAITFTLSKRIAEGGNTKSVVDTALRFLLIIGIIIGAIFYIVSGVIVSHVLNVSPGMQNEASEGLRWLGLGLPFVIITIGLRGVLEAYSEFRKISLISIPSGSLLFIMPTLVSLYSNNLSYVFWSLVVVRCFQSFLFYKVTIAIQEFDFRNKINRKELNNLLRFGSWMTVTNIVSPIMVNMDRFIIGAKLSVSVVTSYVVPFDMITKALVIPSAMSSVFFPEFAKKIAAGDNASKLLKKSMWLLTLVFMPPLLIVFVFSHQLLSLWINSDFADGSYIILRILCVGVFANGLAYLPFSFIQGSGRSDITAKIHVLELIVYLPILIVLLNYLGLIGAAYAWLIRVVLDLILLTSYSFKRARSN
ncbi:TPA: flippase [Citrobacter freundii]|nr:flippase [Citrobacter freundii]HCU2474684.1 flippase [Citrobacter freundii]